MENFLFSFPNEIFHYITLFLEPKDIESFCMVSKKIREMCGNRIWIELLKRDYDFNNFKEGANYKKIYKDLDDGIRYNRIAIADNSVAIIKDNGDLYVRGRLYGCKKIQRLSAFRNTVKHVSLSPEFMAIVTEDGKLHAVGEGQIWKSHSMFSHIDNNVTKAFCQFSKCIYYITKKGDLYYVPRKHNYKGWMDPIKITGLPPLKDIVLISYPTNIAITMEGNIIVWDVMNSIYDKSLPCKEKGSNVPYYIMGVSDVVQVKINKYKIGKTCLYALTKGGDIFSVKICPRRRDLFPQTISFTLKLPKIKQLGNYHVVSLLSTEGKLIDLKNKKPVIDNIDSFVEDKFSSFKIIIKQDRKVYLWKDDPIKPILIFLTTLNSKK